MKKLGAIKEQPWYTQVIAFGVIGVVLYLGFYYFVTKSTREETDEIRVKVEELAGENAKSQAAEQRLNDFKASYARVQTDYDELKALLPEQRELTMVLANIQDRARGQLSLKKFSPKADEQQDFYSSKLIEVGVTGKYNNLGSFFSQMATYQRIVSITDFKLSGLDRKRPEDKDQILRGRTVSAEFKLKAYYAAPERAQPAAPAPAAATPAQPAAAPAAK